MYETPPAIQELTERLHALSSFRQSCVLFEVIGRLSVTAPDLIERALRESLTYSEARAAADA